MSSEFKNSRVQEFKGSGVQLAISPSDRLKLAKSNIHLASRAGSWQLAKESEKRVVSSKVQGFKGSRVQKFKSSRVQKFSWQLAVGKKK
ncbi:MAG: hypothetical protein AB9834_13815 [Lentimicrobium sp.]